MAHGTHLTAKSSDLPCIFLEGPMVNSEKSRALQGPYLGPHFSSKTANLGTKRTKPGLIELISSYICPRAQRGLGANLRRRGFIPGLREPIPGRDGRTSPE